MINPQTPAYWEDYELIDCGHSEKLERFGDRVLIRPEQAAQWEPVLSGKEWAGLHHIRFKPRGTASGDWVPSRRRAGTGSDADKWAIRYRSAELDLHFGLKLTSFKHVGIFPEQAVNWEVIASSVRKLSTPDPRFLNLFAYTGGASMAARQAGADITHVDSIRQVITWASENSRLSGLAGIRWVVEDALKFVRREIRRGRKYQGIILDPPTYGYGPKGERWKLEDQIHELIRNVIQLLDEKESFLILNIYSPGFSPLTVKELLKAALPAQKKPETGELYLQASSGHKLPAGVYGRIMRRA